jgi:glycosyltransferase involved in cell wall biosynthesis
MKISLAYLVPLDEWARYRESAATFAETYRRFFAGEKHELMVVCGNGEANDELRAIFDGIESEFTNYWGGGRDCGAAQDLALRVDCDFLICANTGVYFYRAGWLKRFADARRAHGEGLYGASASFESYPYEAGKRNPHIRTSFFGCNPTTFRQFPHLIDSREKSLWFECGDWNFTRWFENRGEPSFLVTWDGCYRKEDFRSAPNIFRKGDQSNLLIRDRHIDAFEQSDIERRMELEIFADGGEFPERFEAAQEAPKRISVSGLEFVSVGMPIYNAGKYLREALDALRAQDYPHFELVISDNCSEDETEEICRKYQRTDRRIRYIRQAENKGSPWNFAFVAREARYDYFMWAAHDDTRSTEYIGKCLMKLRAHQAAVLCCTEVNFMDAEGRPSKHYGNYKNIETPEMAPLERLHELISRPGWFALYGLMRTEAVQRISLGLDCYGCDVVLLLELLLQGEFVKVPERLFNFRISIEGKTAEDYQKDFNLKAPADAAPYAGLAVRLLEAVYRSNLSAQEKKQVHADFLQTLPKAGLPWRIAITEEMLGSRVSLTEKEFGNLLGLILLRAVPLGPMWRSGIVDGMIRHAPGSAETPLAARESAGERLPSSTAMDAKEGKYRRAARLAELGKLEEASKEFRAALDERESSDGWSDWATIQLACGRTADAEHGFRRSLALDGENASASLKLGVLLAGQGRIREAIPILEQALLGAAPEDRESIRSLLKQCREKSEQAHADESEVRAISKQ